MMHSGVGWYCAVALYNELGSFSRFACLIPGGVILL